MNPDCLQHVLTSQERESFNTNGYLIVPNALDPATNARLVEAVDRIDAQQRTPELSNKLISVPNMVHRDDAFVDLIDCPTTFPKVWGILGWNIYQYHSHMDVTPTESVESREWDVAWHQDSMRVNDEIETSPRPRLSIKIGFYLSDVSQANRGNTLIVPGSHLHDEFEGIGDGSGNPVGAEPLCVQPGTAVIIDRRIWHSRSANLSDITRKVIWFGYSYRWLRPKDAMTVEHLYDRLDPIRRQILGDGLSANGTYDPVDGDVPLRGWLREHCPEAADHSHHGRSQSRPPAMVRGNHLGRQ